MSNEELAALIQQGHKEYIPELYNQVEKFINAKANKFYREFASKCSCCGVDADDLIQEGYLAMLDAIKGYKLDSGFKFLSFINYPIMNRYNVLTGNRNHKAKNNPLNNAKSLDEPLGTEDETLSLSDTIKDDNAEDLFEEMIHKDYLHELHNILEKGMEQMTPEQRTVIQCRYYDKQTLNDTGNITGHTRDHVRQCEAKALRVFRKPKIARTLIPFLYYEAESYSLRGTGLQSFRNSGMSSTERAMEHMNDLEQRFSMLWPPVINN